ncbi:MAG: hypothetical protein AAF993_10835 [Pseudomonadota bacterium]
MNQLAQTLAKPLVALLRLLSRYGTKFLLVELGDDNPHIRMPQLSPGYTIQAMTPIELLPWADTEHDLTADFLRRAEAQGDRCVANFFADDLVGYGFVTASQAPLNGQVSVRVNNHLLYRYKGWTHPDHRRRHLSHARGRLNSKLFPHQPGQRMVSYVEAQNLPARLTHTDVHPVRLGYCAIVRLLGRSIIYNSRTATRFGFRLIHHSNPED